MTTISRTLAILAALGITTATNALAAGCGREHCDGLAGPHVIAPPPAPIGAFGGRIKVGSNFGPLIGPKFDHPAVRVFRGGEERAERTPYIISIGGDMQRAPDVTPGMEVLVVSRSDGRVRVIRTRGMILTGGVGYAPLY